MSKIASNQIIITGEKLKINGNNISSNAVNNATNNKNINNDLPKYVATAIMILLLSLVIAYIVSMVFRPESTKSASDLLTVIVPSALSGLIGFAGGSTNKNENK